MKLLFSIMISPECNLTCSHCYYSDYDNTKKLHYNTFTKILDKVKEVGSTKKLDIEFIVRGGELSMHPENIKYFKYLLELFQDYSYPVKIRMSTNMQGQTQFYKDYLTLIKQYDKEEGNDTNINIGIQYSFHLPAGLQKLANQYHSINNIFKDTKQIQYGVLAGFGKELNSKNEIELRKNLMLLNENLEIRSGTIDNVSHLYSSDVSFNTGKNEDDIYIYNLDFKGFCTNMKTGTNYSVASFKLRL